MNAADALATYQDDRHLEPVDRGLSIEEENQIEMGVESALADKFDSGVDKEWLIDQVGDRCVELAPILLNLFLLPGDGVDARQAFERFMEQMRQDYVAQGDEDLRAEITAEVCGDDR